MSQKWVTITCVVCGKTEERSPNATHCLECNPSSMAGLRHQIADLRAKLAEAEARVDAIRSAFYQEVTKRCTERALGKDFPKCAACDEPILSDIAWHSNCAETIVQERDAASKRETALRATAQEYLDASRSSGNDMSRTLRLHEAVIELRAALATPSKAGERWPIQEWPKR